MVVFTLSNWINPITRSLSLAEMQNNATIIFTALRQEGWTSESICAMLGNMQLESSINPGRWEGDTIGSGGFGLVQWTPSSKLTNWIQSTYGSTDFANGDFQLGRILYELRNGIQWAATTTYPISFQEFTQSTASIAYLTMAFEYNYERGTPYEEQRIANAEYWYEYFGGSGGRVPVWLLFKMKNKRRWL